MIRTVADFLLQLKEKEAARLAQQAITHAPTIGDMYEGLSMDLLQRAVPADLELQLVTGFIHDGSGGMSGQVDCMLVRGAGEPIPYTTGYLWHIADVLAVFEIKKTLYGSELADAFDHLGQIRQLESNHYRTLLGDDENTLDPRTWVSVCRALAQVTGHSIHGYEDVLGLPVEDQAIFNVLLTEATGSIRVVFGYDGFKSESNFRTSLYDTLLKNLGVKGYGPGSFPQLIVSGSYSLVKANGQPFTTPLVGHPGWAFFDSSNANPLALLLEFVWTRLARDYDIGGLWGEDLDQELLRPFLIAHPAVEKDKPVGWNVEYVPWDKVRDTVSAYAEWQPEFVTEAQSVVLTMLSVGGSVFTDDVEFVALAAEAGMSPENFVQSLIDTRLLARAGNELELITEGLVVALLPDGRIVAAENNTGRLSRWLVVNATGATD
jgi:hypothetical protein